MTIAELQLGRMRPLPDDRNSLDERVRARRARRMSLLMLLAAWAAVWLYGLGRFYSAADLGQGLDRFLPLQVVAALAAVAVVLGARRLRVSGWPRWLVPVPAMLTGVGALTLVWLLAGGVTSAADTQVDRGPQRGHVAFAVETVSL